MDLILLLLYIVVLWVYMPRAGFLQRSKLSINQLRGLLAFKWLCAMATAFIFSSYADSNNDYIVYSKEGYLQSKLLLSNPHAFFNELWADVDRYGFGGFFDASFSFWGYLRFHLIHKFAAIISLLSRGNFYINALLFSSLTFWGHIAFYRIFSELYPGKKWLTIFGCFMLPSLLVFTALIHKDGLIFLCLAFCSYVFYKWLAGARLGFKEGLVLTLALLGILLIRNYVLVALLPAMLTAALLRNSKRKWALALVIYLLFTAIFFSSSYLPLGIHLPQSVVKRQQEFALLEKGEASLPIIPLQPTFKSFAENAPQAIAHGFFTPYPGQTTEPFGLLAALELAVLLLLMATVIFVKRKQWAKDVHPFHLYSILFFASMILIIGYTIPNMGAIVRYRSLLWIFIFCPMLMQLPFQKIKGFKNRQ